MANKIIVSTKRLSENQQSIWGKFNLYCDEENVKIKSLITLDGTVEVVAVTFVGTFLLVCAVAELVVV